MIQAGMKRFGHYDGALDGLWGPRSAYAFADVMSKLSIEEQKLSPTTIFMRIRNNEILNRQPKVTNRSNNNQNFMNTLGQAYLLRQLMENNQPRYTPPIPVPQPNPNIRCTVSNGLSPQFRNNTYVNCY